MYKYPQRNSFEMAAHNAQFEQPLFVKLMGEDFYEFFPQCK